MSYCYQKELSNVEALEDQSFLSIEELLNTLSFMKGFQLSSSHRGAFKALL